MTKETKPKTGILYNAWDNVGQMHGQYRVPSQTATATSVSLHSQPDIQSRSSSLSKQTSALNYLNEKPNSPDAQHISSVKPGEWAKQVRVEFQIMYDNI
jgi:hypothetical protein